MKTLLLRANSTVGTAPVPLGLGYVAEAIRKARPRDEVEILDARVRRMSPGQVARRLREVEPDVVGITAFTTDAKGAHEAAALAKAMVPRARVVMGGPYPTSHQGAVLKDSNVDVLVVGEGEETTVELLVALEAGADLAEVRGLVYRPDGAGSEPVFTGPRPLIQDVDGLEVAWDLFEMPLYFKRFGRSSWNYVRRDHRAAMVMTSRGCPYSCIFCHHSFGKKFRPRSAERVVEEVTRLRRWHDVRELEIVDDCFNLRPERAKEILEGFVSRRLGLHVSMSNGIRGDRVDGEMLDLFEAAGVFRVAFAVESASPRVQEIIKKRIDLDLVRESIRLTSARGIMTMGYFIMGFPTETYAEMLETGDYANDSDLHLALFFYLNPFPGTEVARMAGFDTASLTFSDYFTAVTNLSAASDEELRRAHERAFRRFYSNPRRALRVARLVPWNLVTIQSVMTAARLSLGRAVS